MGEEDAPLVSVRVEDRLNMEFVEFRLSRPIEPSELRDVVEEITKNMKYRPVVLLSGRGPIWLYGALIHEIVHMVKAVGVYDPKVQGWVIVASHDRTKRVGDVL